MPTLTAATTVPAEPTTRLLTVPIPTVTDSVTPATPTTITTEWWTCSIAISSITPSAATPTVTVVTTVPAEPTTRLLTVPTSTVTDCATVAIPTTTMTVRSTPMTVTITTPMFAPTPMVTVVTTVAAEVTTRLPTVPIPTVTASVTRPIPISMEMVHSTPPTPTTSTPTSALTPTMTVVTIAAVVLTTRLPTVPIPTVTDCVTVATRISMETESTMSVMSTRPPVRIATAMESWIAVTSLTVKLPTVMATERSMNARSPAVLLTATETVFLTTVTWLERGSQLVPSPPMVVRFSPTPSRSAPVLTESIPVPRPLTECLSTRPSVIRVHSVAINSTTTSGTISPPLLTERWKSLPVTWSVSILESRSTWVPVGIRRMQSPVMTTVAVVQDTVLT